jgi:F420H(2)-dependent quinone reductase
MNETHTRVYYRRPLRPVRMLANQFVATILRSSWHRLKSDRLLLLTFTGRHSGKEFTTPLCYVQEDETLQVTVMSPWWRNLLGETTVRVLLRGQWRTGTTEVLPKQGGKAVVNIHLNS